MSKNYDLPHELEDKLKSVLSALYNVPVVGQKYDQQHADCHLKATLDLKEVIAEFEKGNLIYNQDEVEDDCWW